MQDKEPLSNLESDFSLPLALLQKRQDTSYGSISRIESKTATFVAGTIAIIGLSLNRQASIFDLLFALGFFVPLRKFVLALAPMDYLIAPDVETLSKSWRYYPKASIEATFDAMGVAVRLLSENVAKKSALLVSGMRDLFRWSFVIVIVHLVEAIVPIVHHTVQPPAPVLMHHAPGRH